MEKHLIASCIMSSVVSLALIQSNLEHVDYEAIKPDTVNSADELITGKRVVGNINDTIKSEDCDDVNETSDGIDNDPMEDGTDYAFSKEQSAKEENPELPFDKSLLWFGLLESKERNQRLPPHDTITTTTTPATIATTTDEQNLQSKPQGKENKASSSPNRCNCGEDHETAADEKELASNKILGGEELTTARNIPHQFRWMVAVMHKNLGFSLGGAIIHPKYVLTAAHGLDLTKPEMHYILYADVNRNNNSGTQASVNLTNIYSNNDTALLELQEELVWTVNTRPVCLPRNKGDMYKGVDAVLTGWGNDKKSRMTEALKTAHMTEMGDTGWCKGPDYEFFICTKGKVEGSCGGDSGGPLVTKEKNGRYTLIGILSRGTCKEENDGYVYSLFSRVSVLLDWIQEKSKKAYFCYPD